MALSKTYSKLYNASLNTSSKFRTIYERLSENKVYRAYSNITFKKQDQVPEVIVSVIDLLYFK